MGNFHLQLLVHFLLLDDVQARCDAGAVALKVGLAVSRSQAQPGVMSCTNCTVHNGKSLYGKINCPLLQNLQIYASIKYQLIFFIH